MAQPALEFLVCLVIIVLAGIHISRQADQLASATGLGRTWIGSILLAGTTSLPETFNSLSALLLADAPDLAVGDLMGSCVFNLSLFAVLSFVYTRGSLFGDASPAHRFTASCGVVLLGLASLGAVLGPLGLSPAIGHVGPYALAATAFYFFSMRALKGRQASSGDASMEKESQKPSLRSAGLKFCLAGLILAAAAGRLPFLAAEIADAMGWHHTFVGSLFLAFTTSLPELVVTVAAARQGALDLAVGNIFGSNLFNIGILGGLDLIYLKGPLLASVSPLHAATGLTAIIMTGIVMLGLAAPREDRSRSAETWICGSLVFLFLVNAALLSQAP